MILSGLAAGAPAHGVVTSSEHAELAPAAAIPALSNNTQCTVVAGHPIDPHFTAFAEFNMFSEAYKFAFNGMGAYNVLEKTSSDAMDPCEVEIQSWECPAPCPGPACGQSYLTAVGITISNTITIVIIITTVITAAIISTTSLVNMKE